MQYIYIQYIYIYIPSWSDISTHSQEQQILIPIPSHHTSGGHALRLEAGAPAMNPAIALSVASMSPGGMCRGVDRAPSGEVTTLKTWDLLGGLEHEFYCSISYME